jgi:Rad3-related DNA helicase
MRVASTLEYGGPFGQHLLVEAGTGTGKSFRLPGPGGAVGRCRTTPAW